jgi:hypothetical protein
MLEPWIIEQIRRREEEERRRNERPQLEIPLRDERRPGRDTGDEKDDDQGSDDEEPTERGVVIIPL